MLFTPKISSSKILTVDEFFESFNFTEYFRKFFEENYRLISATYSFDVMENVPYTGHMKFNCYENEKKLTVSRYDSIQCDKLNIIASFDSARPFDFSYVYTDNKDNKDEKNKIPETFQSDSVAYWQKCFMTYLNVKFQSMIDKAIEQDLGHLLCVRYKISQDARKDIMKKFIIKCADNINVNPYSSSSLNVEPWCMPKNSFIRRVKINDEYRYYIDVSTEFNIVYNESKK